MNDRIQGYIMSMSIVQQMLDSKVINKADYREINARMLKRYGFPPDSLLSVTNVYEPRGTDRYPAAPV